MAGRGMGIATKGGGAVESGPKNRMESNPADGKTGPVMMAKGGDVSPRKKMAMGMMGGGMMKKGYAAGGAVKKKMMAGGGKVCK
jgi:hypothetical protein